MPLSRSAQWHPQLDRTVSKELQMDLELTVLLITCRGDVPMIGNLAARPVMTVAFALAAACVT